MSRRRLSSRFLPDVLLVPLLGAALAGLLGTAVAGPASAADAPVVTTREGAVRGSTDGSVDAFVGIRYAQAPTGPRRWAAPVPEPAWSGTRDATRFGARCPQLESTNGPQSLDEDCLFLNVWRPAGARAGEKLPVHVFVHGGGLVNGASDQNQGTQLAAREHVVVVTMNYRLGLLGFLAAPSLPDAASGNAGLLDQQAALRWVHRNVARFGGDPARVALGGESAGGWSVCAHLAAPGSRGLFSSAVIQSGSCPSRPVAQAERDGAGIAATLGCPAADAACLRRLPVRTLLGAPVGPLPFVAGTATLPTAPDVAVTRGTFARVPVLVGANRDEGRTFALGNLGWDRGQYLDWLEATFGDRAEAVRAQYPWRDAGPYTGGYVSGAVITDSGQAFGIGGCPNLALQQRFARWTTTYAYEFAHRTGPGLTPPEPRGYVWGAGHAAELAYVWPSFDNGVPIAATFDAAERRLSRDMTAWWGGFVAEGAPRASGLPRWSALTPSTAGTTPVVMSLRAGGQSRLVPTDAVAAAHKCGFWGLAGS